MSKKGLIVIAAFFVFLMAVSATSAADNATLEDAIAEADQEILQENISVGSFDELSILIGNASEGDILELDRDYRYSNGSAEGIQINKSITIDGKGHSLDGSHLSRAFNAGDNVTLKNINFVDCHVSTCGGAIYWSGSYGILANCSFVNCSAEAPRSSPESSVSLYGGAVYWNGNDGVISNCSFAGCYANFTGGAIHLNGNGCEVFDCSFAECSSNVGGAIYWNKRSRGTLSNCSFVRCHARSDGGAVDLKCADCAVFDCSFVDCSGNVGGAIDLNCANVRVFSCSFINCTSYYDSGAVRWGGDNGALYNCSFANCYSRNVSITFNNGGGAIYCYGSNLTVSNSTFFDCSSNYGGAIFCTGRECVILNCSFVDCSSNNGGAINLGGEHSSVFASSFTGCHANYTGGAIYRTFNAYSKVFGCSFVGCHAGFSGGAVIWYGNRGNLSGCRFADCSSGEGGAVYWYGSNGVMANDDFTGCRANWGGAIYGGSAQNCTFSKNQADEGKNWYGTNVPKLNVVISPLNLIYGFNDTIFINATDNDGVPADVTITLTVFENDVLIGTYHQLTNSYWDVDLDKGRFTVVMSFDCDSYEPAGNNTVMLTISKVPTDILVLEVSAVYGFDEYLVATLRDFMGNPVAGATLSVSLGGTVNVTTNECGMVNLSVRGLVPNAYVAGIAFGGDDVYDGSSVEVNVTIFRLSTSISSADVTGFYNGGKYLTATLKDLNGNAVSGVRLYVVLNGRTYSPITDSEGKVKVSTNSLAPKIYHAELAFKGDDLHNKSNAAVKVTIKKAAARLIAKSKAFKKSDKVKKYAVTLKGTRFLISGAVVKITVNKKTYTAKTVRGIATFNLSKLTKKARYAAIVKYYGTHYNVKPLKVQIAVR